MAQLHHVYPRLYGWIHSPCALRVSISMFRRTGTLIWLERLEKITWRQSGIRALVGAAEETKIWSLCAIWTYLVEEESKKTDKKNSGTWFVDPLVNLWVTTWDQAYHVKLEDIMRMNDVRHVERPKGIWATLVVSVVEFKGGMEHQEHSAQSWQPNRLTLLLAVYVQRWLVWVLTCWGSCEVRRTRFGHFEAGDRRFY